MEIGLGKLDLLVGFAVHEAEGLAGIVKELHDLLIDVDVFDAISGVAGEFDNRAGTEVLDFDFGDHLPHSGFVKEDVEDLIEIAFIDEVIARP